MVAIPTPLFPLGQIVATPAVLAALQDAGQDPGEFVRRHVRGDWGLVNEEDQRSNEDALTSDERIFSVYKTDKGVKIWVITEPGRASTCVLLPDEH